MPTAMTLTGKGQFTFNKQLMEHINVKVGERIVIKKQPDSSLKIEAEKSQIDLMSLAGSMRTDITLTDEQIQESIINSYIAAGTKGM